MQKTIVIGATGTIGSAIVQLLKENGHEILEVSRKGENSIDIDNPKSIADFFSNSSSVNNIICAAGNASFGNLDQLTDEQINLGLKSKLMGQVNLVRNGIQVLDPNGVIILTGGMLAHQPWPGSSAVALVNAGLEGFVRSAALDMTEGKRLQIVHPPLVKETAEKLGMPSENLKDANEVARTYLKGIESHDNGTVIFTE